MKAFLIYQLEVAACLAAFYLFYQFILRQENQFLFQRIYFLFSIVASLVLPALTLELSTTTGIPTILPIEYISLTKVAHKQMLTQATPLVNPRSLDLWDVLFYLWLGGLVFFTIRLIISIIKITEIVVKSKPDSADIRIKKTDLNVHSFSFFKFIVLNKKHDNSHARSIVLAHEHAHANQLHSVDILICELLKCLQWFNPFVWLLSQKVIINLEFLADQAVLKEYKDVDHYQRSLLQFAHSGSYKSLKIEFSKIHLKERFHMMNRNTKTIHPSKWLGLLVLTLMIGFTVSVKGSQKDITEKVNRSINYLMDPAPLQISAPFLSLEPLKSDAQQPPDLENEKIVKVKGKVVTEAGPLADVNIIAEKFSVGTITDADGDFIIAVPLNTELTISKSGYATNKFIVESGADTMSLGVILLSDTIQTGTETELAYVIDGEFYDGESGKVKLDEIGQERFNMEMVAIDEPELIRKYGEGARGMVIIGSTKENAKNSMEEAVPMVTNSPNSPNVIFNRISKPSDTTNKDLFFPNFSDNGQPLIVVNNEVYEGEEVSKVMKQTGIDSIRSITVIKGESATMVYGDKAKNGVILIELEDGLLPNVVLADVGKLTIVKKGENRIGLLYDKERLKPIFVIDDVEYSHKKGLKMLEDVKFSEIIRVYLHEGKVATDYWGQKGEKGVIRVYTSR